MDWPNVAYEFSPSITNMSLCMRIVFLRGKRLNRPPLKVNRQFLIDGLCSAERRRSRARIRGESNGLMGDSKADSELAT